MLTDAKGVTSINYYSTTKFVKEDQMRLRRPLVTPKVPSAGQVGTQLGLGQAEKLSRSSVLENSLSADSLKGEEIKQSQKTNFGLFFPK